MRQKRVKSKGRGSKKEWILERKKMPTKRESGNRQKEIN